MGKIILNQKLDICIRKKNDKFSIKLILQKILIKLINRFDNRFNLQLYYKTNNKPKRNTFYQRMVCKNLTNLVPLAFITEMSSFKQNLYTFLNCVGTS